MLNRARVFFLKDLWAVDASSLGRLKAFFLRALRLLAVITGDVVNGPLTLWAMSLVYTTLLSLVPLLAVSFSVLKAFGVHNKIEPFLFKFLAPLGPKGADLSRTIVEFVDNTEVGVLGFVGLLLLLYTVISLIQKIEESFNALWRVKNMRSLLRRFSDYLSVILVGPVLVVAALGITAMVLSTSITQRLITIEPIGTIVILAAKFVPFLLMCAAFTFVYAFVPNTRVKLKSALVGGVIGGVIWETIGWGFASFIVNSSRYAAIYSGFAIVVLFMIWLYASWLILLIGAEVSFYHQNPRFLSIRSAAHTPDARFLEQTAVSIMYLVGHHFFHNKDPWNTNSLAARLGIPDESVENIATALKKKGLIVETADEPPLFLPARDLETITLWEVHDAVRGSRLEDGLGGERIASIEGVDRIMEKIDAAIVDTLGESTLKGIVRSQAGDGAGTGRRT
ncbi:YhjD/YihY/BrkB family envelope integrity protein [Candidatus Deferrimicrobium sp.]|uniref:YhjD/YihY/BrkB family envelope integrity protein n=1 Tax=Candidatus Deferrimicrobium sp. TaxID=3060586 RepID=UPI002ED85325